MGSLPSSKLTKVLQEKAESLKKRRQGAEAAAREVEERLALLDALKVTLSEIPQRSQTVRDLTRKNDWEGVEATSKQFREYIDRTAPPAVELRRAEVLQRMDQLRSAGVAIPSEVTALRTDATAPIEGPEWSAGGRSLLLLANGLAKCEDGFGQGLLARARALAAWSGENPDRLHDFESRLPAAVKEATADPTSGAIASLRTELERALPGAVERRNRADATAQALITAAEELGIPCPAITAARADEASGQIVEWSTTVPKLERANEEFAELLRERSTATIQSMRATLESLREFGVDPTESLVELGEILGQLPKAPASEFSALLGRAREVTEGPVVSIVAGLLDEVRPRLVEARRLGRDPSEVFQAMNRAREALRLKIYSEALAASQEANEKINGLTNDLGATRAEAEWLRQLLQRLGSAKFPIAPYQEPLARATRQLEEVDLTAARETLGQTIRALGREAVQFFHQKLGEIDRTVALASERGFLPPTIGAEIARSRQFLEEGKISEAAELITTLEIELRRAAGPYVARRVEEIEKGFEDVPDEALVGPVRRLLADTDVNLRVKEDLPGAIESLKRAEREFSAVFAAHASALVEMLEVERRTLESMGGAGDEIQRQIDEVQQIFNMGDFVKASRASQEIRTRARQQQLLRCEESLSHAKLALVELGKMGLDTQKLKLSLEEAHDASRAQQYARSYQASETALDAAAKLRTTAQGILDALGAASDLWQELKQVGANVEPYRDRIREAKQAYQDLKFDEARASITAVRSSLEGERGALEAARLLAEANLLLEDAQRLSIPSESYRARLAEVREVLASGATARSLDNAQALHKELVHLLRPVLEENLRALERDLEIARSAGLDAGPLVESLGEARRRIALPTPTGVAAVLEGAHGQLVETRGFLEHADRATRRTREALNQAELVRVDTKEAKDRLAKIESLFTARDFPRVIELTATLERELVQSTYQHVSKTLAGFQGQLSRARNDGTVSPLAENLLAQARAALEEGRPIEALKLAGRSEGELERIELQLHVAKGTLETMESRIAQAEQEGVRSAGAQEALHHARDAFSQRDFGRVLEAALHASDQLALAFVSARRAKEAIDSADQQVREASEFGADVQDVVPVIEAARAKAATGDYPEATRRARDAVEQARWAVERLYAGELSGVKELADALKTIAPEEPLEAVTLPLEEAQGALTAREWGRATSAFAKARASAEGTLDGLLRDREEELRALYARAGPPSPAEAEAREERWGRFRAERERKNFVAALGVLREESARATEAWRLELVQETNELKERLWVVEKLGLDTTPVMEIFSDAQLAIQSGKLEPVLETVTRGRALLESLVRDRLTERKRAVESEVVFARDALNVTMGPIGEKMAQYDTFAAGGRLVAAAQMLLEAEEELNRRKALHRELLNIHYLIDAALGKAAEKHVDASAARSLLDESIRARASDYALALEKAREALKKLQELLATTEPAPPTAGFWPFRRPGT